MELEPSRRSSIPAGSAWMVLIAVGLFFLPAINGLIAGAVGGYKVGSIKRGLIAALLPAVILGIALWVLFAVVSLPVIGVLAGMTLAAIVVFSELSLFLGAVIGGLIASRPAAIASH
ncbi:MAG TPA: hypothetical protein VML75_14475 [Kofleriaceae bacterium]|nr:hypothetical protein [Kofleriaceae bacterium]